MKLHSCCAACLPSRDVLPKAAPHELHTIATFINVYKQRRPLVGLFKHIRCMWLLYGLMQVAIGPKLLLYLLVGNGAVVFAIAGNAVLGVRSNRFNRGVWWIPKSSSALRSSREPHVMAFGVTNLGVVLVLYPPNSEESQDLLKAHVLLIADLH